ncbi:TonB-dependent siderophore receptor [Brevundimonas sp. P7753]|uniref:TonB-dependent receptor plug domain-containing protein n=1 Tax=Brevundimonas sp. P7753 TaxID=2726982 RepID=UPI0015C0535C|nr:TonB-dependent receptor [Brevundimonas sp. P7753]NWE52108.1 TonB-dependent receptor [Brevundimonas sp. P7753]
MKHVKSIIGVLTAGSSLIALSAAAQTASPQSAEEAATRVDEVIVLGSRIPRQIDTEGPAPVTTITSEDILRNGYQSVPDLLRAVTQNGGETQSQQSSSGASFTPGAQQVDLRGLGPNHTLVLVNGRRIADFPLPFQGQSNFTDVSNIPVGLIERVEVLSGSASAIYGSDAIAGVVNFVLKKSADGTRFDFRSGFTEDGGGESQRLTITTGWDRGAFHGVVGVELLNQEPLWAYDREIQDSTKDSPVNTTARRAFLRFDDVDDYLDPGDAACAALSSLNGGTTYYANRPRYGNFCGSDESIGYGTILSERQGVNAYSAIGYTLNDRAELFLDLQFSHSNLKLFRDVQTWLYQDENGSEDGLFVNADTGLIEGWQRQFSPEEMGGLARGFTHNRSTSFNITPGIKGVFGDGDKWAYEVAFNHAEYRSKVRFPQIIASAANKFFLGDSLGIDPDSGLAIFSVGENADRLYKPLTPAEYDQIAQHAVYEPRSRTDNLSASITNSALFELPAGPVGFAAVVEAGNQGYELNPDPLALIPYYVGLIDSDGKGDRDHWGAGYEVRAPLLSNLEFSTAGRYDHYEFAGKGFGKFTYNAGLEYRPISTVLLRAAYGTGFRAPDLHYVFSGPGNTHPSGTDYFRCATEEPDEDIGDCSYSDEGIVAYRNGNRDLQPETSKSFNGGVVWQATRNLSLSLDYFRVELSDQVRDMSIDTILRDEASCRLGGADPASPTCVDAIARVERQTTGPLAGSLIGVFTNPINIAQETTSGFDVAARLRVPTERIGEFNVSLAYTYVDDHTFQQYPGDPSIDKLAFDSGYYIPRDKGTASVSWALDKLTATIQGQYLGKLPNYDEDAYISDSWMFNASAQYDLTDHVRLSMTVNNLFDEGPVKDPTYSAYPYYDISWFDSVGRSYYFQLTYKFGGAGL